MTTVAEVRRGTDTSGRPLMCTDRFWAAWQAVLRHPRVAPFAHLVVPVQGAFMALVGGGAASSAGYHDRAGCWDVRTWNLTDAQEQALWEVCELYGIHFWKRDPSYAHGGMDEHGHAIALWDGPLDPGAAAQVVAARNRRDGLAHNGPDYMKRVTPPVFEYPAKLIEGVDYMATTAAEKRLAALQAQVTDLTELVKASVSAEVQRDLADRQRQARRYQALVAKIGGLADQLDGDSRAKVLALLAAETDVTGPDNPAPGKS